MSKTVPVMFGDAMFWAYDVALAVLFLAAARVGPSMPADQRPSWWPELAEDFRSHAWVGASFAVLLDEYGVERRRLFLDCVTEAAHRIEARGGVSRDEVSSWPEVDESAITFLRGAEHIDPGPLVELATALRQLADDALPAAPEGRHWLYGTPHGRIVQGG